MIRIKEIIRLGIGGIFIIAAILKLFSIDEFEIYIYSFNVLSFLFTTIFSRLLIAVELTLGLFLIFKIYYKFTWNTTLMVQIFFILFLVYTAIFRNDANCHCFGDLFELNPLESIVKNLVIIALLIVSNPSSQVESLHRFRYLPLAFSILPLALVFIVSPPDSIYKMIYSTEREISTVDFYNVELIMYNDKYGDDVEFDFDQGKHIVAIVSSGCRYCHLGMKKLSMIMKRKGLSTDNIHVFIWGSDEGIGNFIQETGTEGYSYWRIEPRQAINITYGRFPIFVWMDDKEIFKVGDFRDIDEENLQLINN